MIKATVTLNDGGDIHITTNDWNELLDRLKGLDMKELDAKAISPSELKQGKCN